MNAEQFCYWLQGRAELDETPPTPEQWQSIKEHLATVFVKVTPPVGVAPKIFPDYIFDDHRPSQPWQDNKDRPMPPKITCTTDAALVRGEPISGIFMC